MTIPNPYAPPAAPLEPSQLADEDAHLELASDGKRFTNMIVDEVLLRYVGPRAWSWFLVLSDLQQTSERAFSHPFSRLVLHFIVGFAYFFVAEALTGRTLGKLVTGTCVVGLDGRPPTLPQLMRRSLLRFVPFEQVSFVFSDTGMHDRWSGTRVVRVRRSHSQLQPSGPQTAPSSTASSVPSGASSQAV